jgi:hypothetical protein
MPKLNELTKRIRSKLFIQNSTDVKTPQYRCVGKPAGCVKPLDQRLPQKVLGTMMSVLVSVQWGKIEVHAPRQAASDAQRGSCKPRHLDHWHPNKSFRHYFTLSFRLDLHFLIRFSYFQTVDRQFF